MSQIPSLLLPEQFPTKLLSLQTFIISLLLTWGPTQVRTGCNPFQDILYFLSKKTLLPHPFLLTQGCECLGEVCKFCTFHCFLSIFHIFLPNIITAVIFLSSVIMSVMFFMGLEIEDIKGERKCFGRHCIRWYEKLQ